MQSQTPDYVENQRLMSVGSEIPDDEHWHGWRLILAWTVAAVVSYAVVVGVIVGLFWVVEMV